MLADPKARDVVGHFNDLWLHLDEYDSIEKDAKVFPAFTARSGPADGTRRRTSSSTTSSSTADGDVGTLFTAPYSYMNAKLASYYGVKGGPTGDTFAKVDLDPSQRRACSPRAASSRCWPRPTRPRRCSAASSCASSSSARTLPPPPPDIMIKPARHQPDAVDHASASRRTEPRRAATGATR